MKNIRERERGRKAGKQTDALAYREMDRPMNRFVYKWTIRMIIVIMDK